MKKQILAVGISMFIATNSVAGAQDQDSTQNEVIGFGSGAVVGAALGGPIGAFIGGAVGILIADDVNDENKLELVSAQLDKREQQVIALHREMENVREQAQLQLVSLDREIERVYQEHEASIQFRTASYQLEDHYKPQLNLIVESLKANPELMVNVAGHADQRGDDSYNKALSEQRALTVKNYLISEGVKESQIQTQAFGETALVTTGQQREDNDFERRVVLKLDKAQEVMTASNR